MKWERLSKLYGTIDLRVAEHISSKDVQQGCLSDSYLIPLLGYIANNFPRQIERLFSTKNVNSNGIYALRLLIEGNYTTVVIDDYMPYNPHNDKLIYAQKVTKNIWPILLEKAIAKVKGSYEDIEKDALNLFSYILPYTLETHINDLEITEKEVKWNQIQTKLDENCVLIGSTYSEEDQNLTYEEVGLKKQHHYLITNSYYLEDGTKILKIVNHHYLKQNWEGQWSDTDLRWSKSNKRIVDFDNRLPGEFF